MATAHAHPFSAASITGQVAYGIAGGLAGGVMFGVLMQMMGMLGGDMGVSQLMAAPR